MKITAYLFSFLLAFGQLASASDHADPIFNKKDDAGITGLFAFADGDAMVFILNVHRGLRVGPPYDLQKYRYKLHIDTHSRVTYHDEQDRQRYGGSIPKPEGIAADITVQLELDKRARLRSSKVSGLPDKQSPRLWSGVRDDPFIFPNFFGTNVVAMVVSIPMDQFPEGQQDWLVWATSESAEKGKQIDHVGRSLRTMNPRLDFLNTLPPSEHVAAVNERHDDPGFIQRLLMKYLAPLFALRHYDAFPDVMIYTTRYEPGYPNGRRPADDIAALACRTGDCLLWELSLGDSDVWPRKTTNDKPFLTEFPYLAEPWPASSE